jgi:hypothetical protein
VIDGNAVIVDNAAKLVTAKDIDRYIDTIFLPLFEEIVREGSILQREQILRDLKKVRARPKYIEGSSIKSLRPIIKKFIRLNGSKISINELNRIFYELSLLNDILSKSLDIESTNLKNILTRLKKIEQRVKSYERNRKRRKLYKKPQSRPMGY